jgi:hypothetical protein
VALTEHVTMGSEREDITGDGVIDLAHGGAAMRLHIDLAGEQETAEMRIVDGAIYVKTESSGWQSLRVAASGTAGSSDPTHYLASLTAVAPDARAVGTEDVRGVSTTHYQGTIDIERALANAQLPGAKRATLKTMTSLLGTQPMSVDAWIDRDGRLRRFSASFELNDELSHGANSKVEAYVSFELYDFGVDAKIEKPAGATDMQSATQARAAQADLRNGLTAEKTYYTDEQEYADANAMRASAIETSLTWGTKPRVVVSADRLSVCLDERSANGTTYALFDISSGADAGTYYAKVACPATIGSRALPGFDSGGW